MSKINLKIFQPASGIGCNFLVNASEDLRPTTSHETDGKANTRKGSGIAPEFCVYSSHCRFVVFDLNIRKYENITN